ncbi:MAG: 2-hydroxymuconate tautomerase family protein [Arenicella sp.]
MPYVNFKLTPENLTTEKKTTLIRAVTDLLQRELNKNPETTVVTIDVVETDSWGIGGESVTVRRARADQ